MKAVSVVIGLILALSSLVGWVTHLYTCFTDDRWGFLIAGALFAPIGIIHGIGVLLGVW